MEKCMPTPPKVVGREFVRRYYILMNKSPENLHNFFTENASFTHDDIDPVERRTQNADGKMAIRDLMLERKYKHTSTKIHTVDTLETLDNGLIVRIIGEISFDKQPMRPFSQSIILIPHTPFQYFVQNDIFRFCDFDSNDAKSRCDSVISQSMPVGENWGTQCEEYVAPPNERDTAPQTCADSVSDANDHDNENEVKLDTSDSGLSSDAEKAIMDIQSINLKNILQDTRTITKESVMNRGPTPPMPVEEEVKAVVESDITQNHNELFRDSCILTIGNVVNPNIEFDDATPAEVGTSDNDKTQNSFDTSTTKSDEHSASKGRSRKRKDKRKSKFDASKQQPIDEPNKQTEPTEKPMEKNVDTSKQSPIINDMSEKYIENPSPDTEDPCEQDTPKATPEVKTYADLAKAGANEWVDELAARRNSNPPPPPPSTERRRSSRSSMSGRRNSRPEKTPPTHNYDGGYNVRTSPQNDALQVFVGNIPQDVTEHDIRRMFSRFGHLTRIRLHANSKKEWLPLYAFITYDNIDSVRQCLMRKNTFYWPENSREGIKLNVNGDESVDVYDERVSQRPHETSNRNRDFRTFSRNFILSGKEANNKRSPDLNISNSVKSERRNGSTRA